MTCPHLRGDPETTQWCGLAEREHERLDQLKDSYDRILALAWDLEELTDRLAAICPDRELVAEVAGWKARRG